MKPLVYSIDIDGTLCYDTCWDAEQCLNAKPRPDVITKVNELHQRNFIVIHTARRHELYLPTIKWLNKHDVRYHAIRMDKLPCDIIFDLDAVNNLDKL